MLNPSNVLEYCKMHMGFPYKSLEHNDEKVINYINLHTIALFSSYVPDVARASFSYSDRAPGTENLFILNDPEDCDVLDIKDVIHSIGDAFIENHPWLFFPTYDDLPGHYIDIFRSRTQAQLSMTKKAWEFIPPNQLYIMPLRMITDFMVRYERTHPIDYSTIPAQYHSIFLDLALADVKDLFASIREQYQTIATPFGEIPLNPEALRTHAEALRAPAIEKLATIPPSMILEIG